MVSTGVPSLEKTAGLAGYPEKSAILVIGPPGIGKEALGYWFIQDGLGRGDFCLYATRFPVSEVLLNASAFGAFNSGTAPFWVAKAGGQSPFDISNPMGSFDEIRRIIELNSSRQIRVVGDFLSSLLLLNSEEVVYRFTAQLIDEVKAHDAVLLATIEDGMHPRHVLTTMQHLFDGVVELTALRAGLNVVPLLQVSKMLGMAPQPRFFEFHLSGTGMTLHEVVPELNIALENAPFDTSSGPGVDEALLKVLKDKDPAATFGYLLQAFIEDYVINKVELGRAGWRSRGEIAERAGIAQMSLYGREGRYGPVFKALLSSGLIEQRFFQGERGRGGEVVKVRVAYEKELVKRQVDRALNSKERKA